MIPRALVLAMLCAPAALADVRQAGGAAGNLDFEATQAGAKFTGSFRRFQVKLDFDPARPAAGSLDVTVETGSLDTQDGERDQVLKGADFFWVDKYPQAAFRATRFEKYGSGWRATGELAIRGVKKEVPVVFTLAPAGALLAMTGTANLKRLPFGLGQGDWASTEWIGDDVVVRFALKLAPAG
jgi:polyisoprenoid-binding protein YceI